MVVTTVLRLAELKAIIRPGSYFIWWNRLDLDQNRLEV